MVDAPRLQQLYSEVLTLPHLRPSLRVNKIFSKLVEMSLIDTKSTLTKHQINKLQHICSQAEYELEKYWAKKIIKSSNPWRKLKEFPYFNNYQKLTKLEWFSLLSCTNHISHKFIFIGGGPLPLTAIVLAKEYTGSITILDIDQTACELSVKLVKKLGMQKKIRIINADAATFDNYKNFDTFFVAALAGIEGDQKTKLLQKIKSNSPKSAHILARSSWGTRKLLYKPLDKEIYTLFNPLIEVRPQNDVVNSVVILQNG